MKTLFLLGTATIAGVLIAISPVLAQDGQTFRGVVKSSKGELPFQVMVLTVTGGGETHEFEISGSTKITGPYAKRATINHWRNQSVEVTYSGDKEPYRATSIEALKN
jgi:hypothetical protein